MKNINYFLIASALFLMSCGTTKTTFDTFDANIGKNAPSYLSLNLPLGKIDLPAVLVGEEKTPSGGCFQSDEEPIINRSASQIVVKAMQEKSFEADLKVKFENALIKAGLESSLSSLISNKIDSKITDAELLMIDPALSGP
ncbi:MAG: hypothetical protein AAFO07_30450, partial [Bacteroidota bacterium]